MRIREVKHTNKLLDPMDRECFPGLDPYTKAGAYWWVADDKGYECAFAGLKNVGHSTGFLCRVGVLFGYRGQGIQKKLIKVRLAKAKRLGFKYVVTYCSRGNIKSANSLLACGFKLYAPQNPYGVDYALYFRKTIN